MNDVALRIKNGDYIVKNFDNKTLVLRHDVCASYLIESDQINDNMTLTKKADEKRNKAIIISKSYYNWIKLSATATHEITLICDAQCHLRRYAVCDRNKEIIQCNKFKDKVDCNSQFLAEIAGAEKAILIAHKIFECYKNNNQLPENSTLKLNLYTDVKDLMGIIKKSSVQHKINNTAKSRNIGLEIKWIKSKDNPADKFARLNKRIIFSPKLMSFPSHLIKNNTKIVMKHNYNER